MGRIPEGGGGGRQPPPPKSSRAYTYRPLAKNLILASLITTASDTNEQLNMRLNNLTHSNL